MNWNRRNNILKDCFTFTEKGLDEPPKKKLLIVDDEPNLRLLYDLEFRRSGYDVSLASDGPEAIELVKQANPELVILDIGLPGMAGIEVMAEILGRDNRLPVILNSSYCDYRRNYLSWAADAFVIKSSNLDELKCRVRELLQ